MRLRTEGKACRLMAIVAVLALAGCASSGRKAPVEERSTASKAPAAAAVAAPASTAASAAEPAAKPLPGIENAGKPGYYTIRPGDTLVRIALDNGQNWRDLARWNNLDNPNLVEVGQVLRVVPPAADPTVATTRPIPSTGRVETRPLDSRSPAPAAGTASGVAAPAGSAPLAGVPASAAAPPTASAALPSAAPASPPPAAAADNAAARDAGDEVAWIWPAAGPVLTGFDEGRNKGLTISGKAGDPVVAAGDGRVVYAGSSLRGYGNLVIVKHNDMYLTAYAHNQVLLVKDDQVVRRGQKIAEMGSSDAERVQLHFEIRRQGKPVDPAKLLPAR
jgi:lipoprotein NlpD